MYDGSRTMAFVKRWRKEERRGEAYGRLLMLFEGVAQRFQFFFSFSLCNRNIFLVLNFFSCARLVFIVSAIVQVECCVVVGALQFVFPFNCFFL